MSVNTIETAVIDMRTTIVNRTNMLYQDYELEFVNDLAVRVMSIDPVTFEYAVTDGNETFRCYNERLFVNVLAGAIFQ